MSWITVIWSMNAAVCLTLAGIHFIVWLNSRKLWGHLLFSCSAVAAAAVAACELLLMRSETVEECGLVLRWAHVPVWLLVISIVGFTRFHLRAGWPWLAWATVGTRTLVLVLNFATTPNINFQVIHHLNRIPFLGEFISLPSGTVHPWVILAKLSSLLLLAFLINASIEVWRRGERRRAIMLGGSMIFFITAAAVHFALLERGIIQTPYLVSLAYLGTILVMAYELSREVLRAVQIEQELRKSEISLRESEQRMELAASAAEMGLWSWDIISDEIWATEKARALFGFTISEPICLNKFLMQLHPDDREPVTHAVAKSMNGDGDYKSEHRLLLPDKPVFWLAARGRVVRDSAGKAILMRGVSLDITARKQAELEVQQQRNELAHLSRVATVSELSGSLAHELNQPLGIILTNAQAAQELLIQDPPVVAEVGEILSDIVAADRRASEIIVRLRALLKRGESSLLALSLNDLIEEVLRLVRADLISRGTNVVCEWGPNLPPVNGDRVQLQQVMLNLVMNAADAMAANSPGQRRVHITTTRFPQAIRTSVRDEGGGLPANIEQMFQPFFTTKDQGLGMGLAICRSIITAHHGRLWAEPHPECGAVFHFELPVPELTVSP